jgi:hypothetical protein
MRACASTNKPSPLITSHPSARKTSHDQHAPDRAVDYVSMCKSSWHPYTIITPWPHILRSNKEMILKPL